MKKNLILALILLLNQPVFAQNPWQAIDDIKKPIMEYKPFEALKILRSNKEKYLTVPSTRGYYYQALATASCMSGIVNDSLIKYSLMGSIRREPVAGTKLTDTLDLSKYEIHNAKNHIIERAKNEEVIMINEAHDAPADRLFMKNILEDLRREGYINFCVEAILYQGLTPFDNIKPILDKGFYTKEPCYAEMMREALRLGYKIYGYEATDEDYKVSNNRDSMMAVHVSDIHNQNGGKTIVYGGYGHTAKTGTDNLYFHFKNLTGITPLSIEQATYTEKPTQRYEKVLYIALWTKNPETREALAIDNCDTSDDITVFKPRLKYINGRADFLFDNGSRKQKLINVKQPSLIRTYYIEEYKKYGEKCTPIDVVIAEKPGRYFLMLPKKGKFKIVERSL